VGFKLLRRSRRFSRNFERSSISDAIGLPQLQNLSSAYIPAFVKSQRQQSDIWRIPTPRLSYREHNKGSRCLNDRQIRPWASRRVRRRRRSDYQALMFAAFKMF